MISFQFFVCLVVFRFLVFFLKIDLPGCMVSPELGVRVMCYLFLTQHNEEVMAILFQRSKTQGASRMPLLHDLFESTRCFAQQASSWFPFLQGSFPPHLFTFWFTTLSSGNVQIYETSINCFINLKTFVIYLPPLMFSKTGHIPKAIAEIGNTYTSRFW